MTTQTKPVRALLRDHFDSISLHNGVWTVRREFFYRHGRTSQELADAVKRLLPPGCVTIVDQGEVWKPFNGGASAANSSHWFVKFTVTL